MRIWMLEEISTRYIWVIICCSAWTFPVLKMPRIRTAFNQTHSSLWHEQISAQIGSQSHWGAWVESSELWMVETSDEINLMINLPKSHCLFGFWMESLQNGTRLSNQCVTQTVRHWQISDWILHRISELTLDFISRKLELKVMKIYLNDIILCHKAWFCCSLWVSWLGLLSSPPISRWWWKQTSY